MMKPKVLLSQIERENIVRLAHETLLNDDDKDVEEARIYLKETRKLSDEVLKQYKFGYIPKRIFHSWAERIIMPLFDPYGELVVLTSRKFRSKDPDDFPHLHETFDKRYYLYGLDVAKDHIRKNNKVIVVEGQMDTCSLKSHKINTAVGILGSAFTLEHICILRRYCTEVYLCFDNDKSGKMNLERSLDLIRDEKIEETFNMIFVPVLLPSDDNKKQDPDEFVKTHGPKKFVEFLQESKLFRKQFSLKIKKEIQNV